MIRRQCVSSGGSSTRNCARWSRRRPAGTSPSDRSTIARCNPRRLHSTDLRLEVGEQPHGPKNCGEDTAMSLVEYQARDRIAEIILEHPPVNALTEPMLDELLAGLERAA